MKTFKSFILEMGQLLQHYDDRDTSVTTKTPPKNIESHGKLHSVMDSGHEVRLKRNNEFRVVDPKTKLAQITLTTNPNLNNHSVETLSGRKGSTVKAHELYHHLITKLRPSKKQQ